MYVHSCSELFNLDDSGKCAKKLLKWFMALNEYHISCEMFRKLKDTLDSLSDDDEYLRKWEAVMDCISDNNFPILFVLDQWNAIADPKTNIPDRNPISLFKSAGFKCGAKSTCFFAVSSSFSPVSSNSFVDDQRTSYAIEVETFTKDEGMGFLEILKNRIGAPEIDTTEFKEALRDTSGLPRLLEYYYRSKIESFPYKKRCAEYYHSRAKKLSDKLRSDRQLRLIFLDVMFSMMLRKSARTGLDNDLRLLLINTGLLREEDNNLVAYNVSAMTGIDMIFRESFTDWLSFSNNFGSDSTKGDVLELFL